VSIGDQGGLLAAFDTILRQSASSPALAPPSEGPSEEAYSEDNQQVPEAVPQSSGEKQFQDVTSRRPTVESVVENDPSAKIGLGAEEPLDEPVSDSVLPAKESQVLPTDVEQDKDEEQMVAREAELAIASRLPHPTSGGGPNREPENLPTELQPVDGVINPMAEKGEKPRSRHREKDEVVSPTPLTSVAKQGAPEEAVNEQTLHIVDDGTTAANGSEPVEAEANSKRRSRRSDRLADASGRRGMEEAVGSQSRTEQNASGGSGERGLASGESQVGFMDELLLQMERTDNGTFPGGLATTPGNGPTTSFGDTMATAVVVDRSAMLATTSSGGTVAGTGGQQVEASGAKVDAGSSLSNVGERVEKSTLRGLERGNGTSSGDGSITTSNEQRVRLVQRVARAFQRIGPGGGQVHMMLHPAELGSVRLAMSINGSHVQALLTAESPAAENVLREHLPELRQRLADSGLVVDRMEVQSEQRESSRDSSQGRENRDGLSQFSQYRERQGGHGDRRPGEQAGASWERSVGQEAQRSSGAEEPTNGRIGSLGRMGKESWLRASLDVRA
jgi:flagellar hook-length control protein FliK